MADKKEDKIYQIKNLSEKQIRVMKDALEMYTRLGILQFDHLIDHMFNWGKSKDFSDAYLENRDQIEYHCTQIKALLVSKDEEMKQYGNHTNWSLGIGSPKTPIVSQIAYELEKDIDLAISKDPRGRLQLSDETPSIAKEQNPREEKVNQILNNLKKED